MNPNPIYYKIYIEFNKLIQLIRSKREKNREKYSSLSESINNLSDGVSIIDFNSVADPYERGRKSSVMSLSMTSSIGSEW